MAKRLIRFISETQARLGWVDTIGERCLYQTLREIKSIAKAPKRLLASLLIVLTIARPTVALGDPVSEGIAKAIEKFAKALNEVKAVMEDSKTLQESVKKLTGDAFAKDLINGFKQIQLARASIEAISTSSLADTVDPTKINMNSGINLENNDVLGSTKQAGEYQSLRLRSRQFVDKTDFSDAAIFREELGKVTDEFDAMQIIRYQAQNGDKVGQAILNGNVEEASKAVEEQWQEILNDKDGGQFDQSVKDIQQRLERQKAQEERELEQATDLGLSEPDKDVMSALLDTKHAISQKALFLGAEEIRNAKKNNEINNSGVTYMMESAKIKAQIQSIINDVQKRVYEIIKLNKAGNSSASADAQKYAANVAKDLNPSAGSNTTDFDRQNELAKMKLRPSADAEINRLIAMANFAIKQQHLQLVDLQEKDRRIKAMDDAGKASFDRQKGFLRSFDESDAELVRAADDSKKAMATYKKKSAPKKPTRNGKPIDITTRIKDANGYYFANAKKATPLDLLKRLFEAYIVFVKKFFQGADFKEAMTTTRSIAEAEKDKQDEETLNMYDKCAGDELPDASGEPGKPGESNG
jgi:hypothetical protein